MITSICIFIISTLKNPIRKNIALIIWTARLFIIVTTYTAVSGIFSAFVYLYSSICESIVWKLMPNKMTVNIETVLLIDLSTFTAPFNACLGKKNINV